MRSWMTPLLILLPGLASAGPDVSYGVAFEVGGQPSALHLGYCQTACFAEVRFKNTYLYGGAFTRRFPLDLDGLAVTVTIVDGQGMLPEVFSVTPPPGFIAEPAEVPVEEDGSGVIALYPMPMS